MTAPHRADVSPLTSRPRLVPLVNGLLRALHNELDAHEASQRATQELRRHLPSPDVLTETERIGNPDNYVQHILHVEASPCFSIVALVWQPGQSTPIHDHVSWCVVGVIQGDEYETRFEVHQNGPDDYLVRDDSSTNPTGSVCGFAPPGDVHLVRNSGDTTAISLHVYGADITELGSSIRRSYDLPVREDQ